MNSLQDARYRLTLARGYMEEAEQLRRNELWRASLSSAQLSVENAAKSVLALFRPIVKVHDLGDLLLNLVEEHKPGVEIRPRIEQLAACASRLGFKEHILTDYGDELTRTPPWEICTEARAESALAVAREALQLAEQIISRSEG